MPVVGKDAASSIERNSGTLTHTDTIPWHQIGAFCVYPCHGSSTFNAYRSGILLSKENKQVAEVDTHGFYPHLDLVGASVSLLCRIYLPPDGVNQTRVGNGQCQRWAFTNCLLTDYLVGFGLYLLIDHSIIPSPTTSVA